MSAKKVLICGDAQGNIKQVFDKVKELNSGKAGPFHVLFICGFWGSDREKAEEQLAEYKSGEDTLPLPVFFVDELNKDKDEPVCPKLTALGSGGVRLIEGFQVAYANSRGKNSQIVSLLARDASSEILNGADVLLTTKWPEGIRDDGSDDTSSDVTELTQQVKPRYHFTSRGEEYFDKGAYRNTPGTNADLTRFYSLASAFSKAKFINALSIPPISTIDMEYINNQLKGDTPPDAPFTTKAAPKKATKKHEEEFEKIEKEQDKGYARWGEQTKRQAAAAPQQEDKSRQQKKARGTCWFCLGEDGAEHHLVASIGEHLYMALPKGPINQDHVLIIPINHVHQQQLGRAGEQELERYKEALKKCYQDKGMDVIFFEMRGIHHCNINAVGVSRKVVEQAEEAFISSAKRIGYRLSKMNGRETILDYVPNHDEPYFYLELPDARYIYHGSSFPFQFAREVMVYLLGLGGEVIDWRNCQVVKDVETKHVEEFKRKFKSYDFNL
ncbi:hypothetical protein PROFUN_04620 [Planoprotostelium fungivorum]|uniref:Uncharacterized protein n=1 Tax=Planoprotostelium fungivorum TaxID=1890364 RepID=A0A2P6NUE3_9EUKA|nr:hypothetical protein PROFUN_04620 [Planoprotostelium fungivorum]